MFWKPALSIISTDIDDVDWFSIQFWHISAPKRILVHLHVHCVLHNIFRWLHKGLKGKNSWFTGILQGNCNAPKNLVIVNKLNEIQNQHSNSASLSSYEHTKFLKIPQRVSTLNINSQNGKPSGKGMPFVVYGDKVSKICTFV